MIEAYLIFLNAEKLKPVVDRTQRAKEAIVGCQKIFNDISTGSLRLLNNLTQDAVDRFLTQLHQAAGNLTAFLSTKPTVLSKKNIFQLTSLGGVKV